MSFHTSEQLLLELLFDDQLREDFTQDPNSTLEMFGLEESEIQDFKQIRLDALNKEANMRKNMIASQITKHAPISIALLSSFDEGFDLILKFIQPYLIKCSLYERSVMLLKQIISHKEELTFYDDQDEQFFIQILQAEINILEQASAIENSTNKSSNSCCDSSCDNIDMDSTIKWSQHTCFNLLPCSYWQLKDMFCIDEPVKLWRALKKTTITPMQRVNFFNNLNNLPDKILISHAYIEQASVTDYHIDFKLVELIDGFLPLIQLIGQGVTPQEILNQFKDQGANDAVLHQARQGFETLINESCCIQSCC